MTTHLVRYTALVTLGVAAACTTPPPAQPAPAGTPPGAAAPGAQGADTTHAHHGPPAPAPTRVLTDAQGRRFTTADVEFMQHMIWHHAQALAMTSMVEARTGRADIRALAERIRVSQEDEIASMRQWLLDRGQAAPDPATQAEHGGAHAGMPGMLSTEQLARLRAARGPEFDRLFLELMIQHHEGAITMVRRLFSSPASGQDSQLFAFASDVEADQAAEIARMRRLLGGSATGTPPR